MISDLSLARRAFAQSSTSVDAQLMVATLRLEVENLRTEALQHAAATGIESAEVSVELSEAGYKRDGHIDKTA